VKNTVGSPTLISAITTWIIGIFSIYTGFINTDWIQFFIGIGFLIAGIYLMKKFNKDKKKLKG